MNIAFLLFSVGIGLLFGSFLNAVIWRTRNDIAISRGRSICTSCKVQIAWYDNIPVLSYIVLRGECRTCNKPISLQYPLVELATALLFLFVAWFYGLPQHADIVVRDWFLMWFLLFIFVYDYLYQEIPDRSSLVPVGGLLLFSLIGFGGTVDIVQMILAGTLGAGFFLFQFVISKGKWIGGGDIRLGLLMGCILGWKLLLVALLLAYVLGAIVGIGMLVAKTKEMQSEIAFGTFLTVATFITMYWGDSLLDWYLALL